MPSVNAAGSKRKADDSGPEKSRNKKKRKNPPGAPCWGRHDISISETSAIANRSSGTTRDEALRI